MTIGAFEFDKVALASFCTRWGVRELAVFGSVLRHDFNAQSDVDVLVSWRPGVRRSVFDVVHMKEELAEIFGRNVDLAQRHLVELDYNEFRRASILENAQIVYAAA